MKIRVVVDIISIAQYSYPVCPFSGGPGLLGHTPEESNGAGGVEDPVEDRFPSPVATALPVPC